MTKERLVVKASLATLKGQLRKDEKFSQGVRLYAVYQIAKGRKAGELGDLYNTSHESICNWVHRYNSEGLAGLINRPRSGRPSRLSDEQKEVLKQVILNKPEDYGYSSGAWTGALVISYIEHAFAVQYKKAQIYNLLRDLGFSFQRGRAAYPEVAGREAEVGAIKKTSRPLQNPPVLQKD